MTVLLSTGETFTSLAAGYIHTCGLTPAGAAYCWGDNEFGQLGDGTTTDRLTPTPVATPVGVRFASLDAGWIHSCGLTPEGAAYCWGENSDGTIGDGTTTNRLIPTAVTMPAGVTFTSLAVGILHTCGLTAAGTLYCWGANQRGRVGDGTTTNRLTPVPVAMPAGVTFTSVSAGYAHTCGPTPAGSVYCWGRNVFGELGDGTLTERHTPGVVAMPAGVTFTSLAVGYVHTCALTPAGAPYCWGVNANGRLGDGTITNRLTPTKVVQP
jgi:alpha-tubulin suppressor-like RCC1 family protein